MSKIEIEIKQTKFKSDFSKALINLIYTSNYFSDVHANILRPFKITTPQFNILRILRGQHPKASTVNLLIERMLDKSSNASRIVDKLEVKGLVVRKQCKTDRRAVDVFISNKGLLLLSKLDIEFDILENKYNTLTPKESNQLNNLLDKMRN